MEAIDLLTYKGARQLFETLHSFPKRQFSINELSKTAKLPFTSTWKLLQKFERASVVEISLIGKSRAVRYLGSPFSRLILEILRLSKTPQQLSLPQLKKQLKGREGLISAYLFGSVAKNSEKLESDIDIALLCRKKMDLSPLIFSLYESHGVKIVPLEFHSKEEFDDFLKDKGKVRLA